MKPPIDTKINALEKELKDERISVIKKEEKGNLLKFN